MIQPPLLPANEYGVEKGTIFLNVGVPPSETFGIARELSTNKLGHLHIFHNV